MGSWTQSHGGSIGGRRWGRRSFSAWYGSPATGIDLPPPDPNPAQTPHRQQAPPAVGAEQELASAAPTM
eukprot:9269094-Pyramimonas_sp.AAC.1